MRFACNREQLAEAISTVERAVPSRDVDDHLKGILLEAFEDRLQLTAFDLHLGIECSTPAEVERQGAVMVDARLFSQLTRKLPSDKVEFSRDPGAGAATVRSGRAEFTINVRDAGDFPSCPLFRRRHVAHRRAELKDMIRQTAFAAAVDDHRSYLNGVLFEVEEDRLNLVATDSTRGQPSGRKLAQPSPQTRRAVVPARAQGWPASSPRT